jgi:hypothetical protein
VKSEGRRKKILKKDVQNTSTAERKDEPLLKGKKTRREK